MKHLVFVYEYILSKYPNVLNLISYDWKQIKKLRNL